MTRFSLSALPGLAFLLLIGCGGPSAPAPTAAPAGRQAPRDQLAAVVERYWDDHQSLDPLNLPEGAATRFDAAAGYDISAQFLADSLALERRYLEAVIAVPGERLDPESRLTYDIFRREREQAVESFTYPSELLPVNPFRSMPLLFAQTGAGGGQFAILSAKDLERWQDRAAAFSRWTGQAVSNMRDGMRRGYTLPRVLVEEMLPLLASLGTDTPANVFYQPLKSIPVTGSDSERRRFTDSLSAGVRDKILPSYRTLHDFLRNDYLPRARADVGLSALPLGDEWYAFLIRRETSTALTAAELHAAGLAEVERLHGRLQALLAENAPAGNLQGYYDAMRRDPRFASEEPPEFLNELKVQVATAVPGLFAQTPQADFAIRPVEAFREAGVPALSYQRATPNGKTPAVLLVNPARLAAQPAMTAVVNFLREAVPGHHLQLAIQQDRANLPRFRKFGGTPAFVAGWGLYAASLGEELGLFRDPESKFAAVLAELECATALVTDTGLHSQRWTRQRALDYVHAQLPIDEAAVREAVDREIALPGEALGCTMGERKIRTLRQRAEQALGDRFDVRAFHAELLGDGAMPLDLLDAKVKRWLGGYH
jgi:uncharacterized protein (DUF885 family)